MGVRMSGAGTAWLALHSGGGVDPGSAHAVVLRGRLCNILLLVGVVAVVTVAVAVVSFGVAVLVLRVF